MSALTSYEASLIKTMLDLKLTDQKIHSYFTQPNRDINQARITGIKKGKVHAAAPNAPLQATKAYMKAREALLYHDGCQFFTRATLSSIIAALRVTWWPVGQGLFMTGRLEGINGGQFNWVYDCGSTSGASERDKAIQCYRNDLTQRKIDLVILSHFDNDHINGIIKLIEGISVHTLLLPYVPLWQRLLIAIKQGVTELDTLFNFYLNPAEFISSIEGIDINEIVFVPPAGPDDIVPGPGETIAPEYPIEGSELEDGPSPDNSEGDLLLSSSSNVHVRFIRPQGRIVVSSLWEFVPYNDASMLPIVNKAFICRVDRIAKYLLNKTTRRKQALAILKRIYKKTFGAAPDHANLISLFLYSGPLSSKVKFDTLYASASFDQYPGQYNLAQLSTGDGYLNTIERFLAFKRFYSGGNRLDRAGLIQVMHHGARDNWKQGLGAELKPAASIFSSDPNYSHGHPHAEVLRDFWSWHPIKVDKSSDFTVYALLRE